jgi:hypothetical protein
MIRKKNNKNNKVKNVKIKYGKNNINVKVERDTNTKIKQYIYQNEIIIDDTDKLDYINNVKNDPNNYVLKKGKVNCREPFNENKPIDINMRWDTIIRT